MVSPVNESYDYSRAQIHVQMDLCCTIDSSDGLYLASPRDVRL
jgi:hypothetical protein